MSNTGTDKIKQNRTDTGYFWSMSEAARAEESVHGLQLVPAVLFTAVVILLVRMYRYTRDMTPFFWSDGSVDQVEFFSHYKVVLIVICAVLTLLILLFRFVTQSFALKRSVLYIPMGVYVLSTLLSFAFSESDYKDFAWNGFNDRFEGTCVLLCYMLLLFYVVNSVNTERNVKHIVYPIAVSSGLLSLLGLSQFLNHDFFRTTVGQKLLVANTMNADGNSAWDMIDLAASRGEQALDFTFKNREIYQTVYNINYVSFYLTLLVPLFGMLFIREKHWPKKTVWGVLFALVIANLIGSASSGGILGMFFVVVAALIVLNKRILAWWKSVAILLAVVAAVAAGTYGFWYGELNAAIGGVLNRGAAANVAETAEAESDAEGTGPARIDYFINDGSDIIIGIGGESLTLRTNPADPYVLSASDADGKDVLLTETLFRYDDDPNAAPNSAFKTDDPRFDRLRFIPAAAESEDGTSSYYCIIRLTTDSKSWPFALREDGTFYHNELGRLVRLENVPHIGWSQNPGFGSGRGYIWSRTLPMLKDTLILGHGADTYCLYFPHHDYVGKHNAGWNMNMIVDKPHNLYMGVMTGTGGISLLALLALFGIYIVQSFRLYRKRDCDDFRGAAGAGIFFGIFGFLISALVDDSSVSVMPLFYGLLGVGIAINLALLREARGAGGASETPAKAAKKGSGGGKGAKRGAAKPSRA